MKGGRIHMSCAVAAYTFVVVAGLQAQACHATIMELFLTTAVPLPADDWSYCHP
jgi:hypothetical protein